jgi:membrane protease YdiL (CAAX protease family)
VRRSALLRLLLGLACIAGATAFYRVGLHPLLESALHLDPQAASIVKRISLFVAIVAAYWGFVRLAEKRPVTELAVRPGPTLFGAVAGAASIGVTIAFLYATHRYELVGSHGLGPALDVLGTLWLAAVLEEIVFRCLFFRLLEQGFGMRIGLVLSALAFAVAHVANGGAGWLSFVTVTLAGLMWAGVFALSRNLWVTTAHHCFWNATIFATGVILSGQTEFQDKAPLITVTHGSPIWTGGAFGPENSPVTIVVMIAACAVLARLVKARSTNDTA